MIPFQFSYLIPSLPLPLPFFPLALPLLCLPIPIPFCFFPFPFPSTFPFSLPFSSLPFPLPSSLFPLTFFPQLHSIPHRGERQHPWGKCLGKEREVKGKGKTREKGEKKGKRGKGN